MTTKLKIKPVAGTVCPHCGLVSNNEGRMVTVADGLDIWRRQGYKIEKCTACQSRERRDQDESIKTFGFPST